MNTILSKDGTRIAYEVTGQGEPLVLLHGTSADHTRWKPVLPALNDRFTVYAVDRRGRGGSGDNQPYALEREFEDAAALVDSISRPVNLRGHSYWGLVTLGAAFLSHNIRRLVLYEPAIFPQGMAPAAMTMQADAKSPQAQIQMSMAAGDREGVVTTFLRYFAEVPDSELAILRASPAWQGRLASAHTIPREIEVRYQPNLEQLKTLHTPTLLLLGGASPDYRKSLAELLHNSLPNSSIAVLLGQQHTAMNSAPELFIKEVLAFLEAPVRVRETDLDELIQRSWTGWQPENP